MTTRAPSDAPRRTGVDSPEAWGRLALAVTLSAVGGVGMWSVVVALPAVEAEFGTSRAGSSLSYTLLMLGFAAGGVLMGRVSDRFGVAPPAIVGALLLSAGYALAGTAGSVVQFALAHGLLIGIGASATFGPLIAEISHWFVRRRGIAVAICASGNYVAGAIWPPVVQAIVETQGWRAAHLTIAVVVLATMIPLALLLRRRAPTAAGGHATAAPAAAGSLGLSPRTLAALLMVAGVSCCVAMSMPQVHIVAYCGELGYGAAAGAQMLSLMLAFGIVSRVASGFVADRIGGLATLLLGSALQALALVLYLLFDGLVSLYVISALFGLFQGGIVPSYAIIVREYFAPARAGVLVGLVLMSTILGMALGGVLSGWIFDLTGSYAMAFLNGVAWNLVNLGVAALLLARRAGGGRLAAA